MKKLYIILLLGTLLVSACRKEKTTWNSDWVLPIVNDTLSLKNFVNDSTINSNSSFYQLDLTRTILDLGIEDLIAMPDTLIIHSYNSPVASLSVPPGFSIVNNIEEHPIDLNDIQLKKIRVSNGSIKLKVFNPVNTITYFTVQLPGVTKNGVLFEEQFTAPAGSTSNPGSVIATLDISGFDIDLRGISGNEYNILQSKLIIKTNPSGPSITLSNSQVFKVEAEFKDVKIDYARGYFGNTIVSDTLSYLVEALNTVNNGTIDLPSSVIKFKITNGLKVDVKSTVTKVSNTNYAGNTVDLNSTQIGAPIYINSASGSWSTLTNSLQTIEFNETNSNIENYLENLGNVQTVGYKLELNPWGNTSGGWNEIFPNSRFIVKLNAQMPLSIGADGLVLRDTFDFDISQDLNKSRVESGIITLNATNAFPFSSDVKLYLLNANGTTLYTITGSSTVKSSLFGNIDPQDGKQKMGSEVNFILSDAMLLDINKIKKVAVETEFNTPDPATMINQQVLIPVGAFMAVKLKAKLILKAVL